MEKIEFKDLPDTTTPIDADNLNLLQDNIEGWFTDVKTWTPTLANASCTYTRQEGFYLRFGSLVFIQFRIVGTINSVSSPGYAYINRLPVGCPYETAGSLFEHDNVTNDNNRKVLLRVIGHQIGLQKDDSSAGAVIDNWYASNETFYLSGAATYITNDPE